MNFQPLQISNEEIGSYYEPVQRDKGSNLFKFWRAWVDARYSEYSKELRLMLLDTPEKYRLGVAVKYLSTPTGTDIFNWIHLEGGRPVFGKEESNPATYDHPGEALRFYGKLIKAINEYRRKDFFPLPGPHPGPTYAPQQAERVEFNPLPLSELVKPEKVFAPPSALEKNLGLTGVPNIAGEWITSPRQRDLPHFGAEAEAIRSDYLKWVGRIGGDHGTQTDFANILPLTYFAHALLDWVKREDKEGGYKALWDSIPEPINPLAFWEELNRRIIAGNSRVVSPIGLPKIILAKNDMTPEEMAPYIRMLKAMSTRDKVKWMELNIVANWSDKEKGEFISLSKSRYSELKKGGH